MTSSTDAEIVSHVLSNKDDYYRLLNIQKSATEDEVKKAYKKLALKLHPDKNKHPKAEDAFKHVATAHQTLSDKEKRRIYDRHGQQGVQQHESYGNNNNNFPFAGGAGNPFAGGASSGMSFNGQEVNLDDFIQEILKTFGTHSSASTNEENFNQQKSKKKKPPGASSSMITVSGVFQFLIVLVIMVTSISFIVLVAVIRKLSNFFVKKS